MREKSRHFLIKKKKLREFITTKPTFQEMMKRILQVEMKGCSTIIKVIWRNKDLSGEEKYTGNYRIISVIIYLHFNFPPFYFMILMKMHKNISLIYCTHKV